MPERVEFQTKDAVTIVGTFDTMAQATYAVLLLHMMPAVRASWLPLQEALHERGIASLAIDLRGHGESVTMDGRRLDYRTFSDAEHQGSLEDVRAAFRWLDTRGFPVGHVGIAGASIGANLALRTAVDVREIPAVALLSAGENFRGIETFPAARALTPDQALFGAASEGDEQRAFEDTKRIVELAASTEKTFRPFASDGHGTNLFVLHPEFIQELADWFASRLKR